MSRHISGDRGLTRVDAEFEDLADFKRDLRSAAARARLPSPEQAKPGPMPADDRLRLDDHQGVQGESQIEPDRLLDDFGRNPVPFVADFLHAFWLPNRQPESP
jgi:hypothetical protein